MGDKKRKLHTDWETRKREHRKMDRESGWGKGWTGRPRFQISLLRPSYLGIWLMIGLLWLIVTLLPYTIIMWLGRMLGLTLVRLIKNRKYVTDCNLRLAFPDMPQEERDRLARKIFINSGQAVFETGIAWFWSDRRLLRHSAVDEEEIKRARELIEVQHKRVLVMTAHFVTLEIMARLYALHVAPGIGIYRSSDHPLWEYLQVKGRLRSNLALVDRNDPRSIVKALMSGHPTWYPPDQDYGPRVSIFAPFFGVENAATITGPHDLARIKNTVVQPYWIIRSHSKYHLHIGAPLEGFPSADARADTIRCNRAIEKMILMAPEQYLWVHRRFKTAPPGEPSRYPEIE
ncbi:MAG: LpxL/LpxP family Kdo(2)-lipid IV(A) lauroyl/palmitoleoyl acyltransferase [Succinivibrionaceae bacterium]|nr:LpxL/LpxP family Kdo(2)-lipid IV(A) lauroyl/palmitoleoyl acyltransferase [Succinivibrionaceae bacterium]